MGLIERAGQGLAVPNCATLLFGSAMSQLGQSRKFGHGPAVSGLSRSTDHSFGRRDPFGNGVGQMLALAKKEATAGPPLPFGPMVVGSSK
jgi:hypothetical protein